MRDLRAWLDWMFGTRGYSVEPHGIDVKMAFGDLRHIKINIFSSTC